MMALFWGAIGMFKIRADEVEELRLAPVDVAILLRHWRLVANAVRRVCDAFRARVAG